MRKEIKKSTALGTCAAICTEIDSQIFKDGIKYLKKKKKNLRNYDNQVDRYRNVGYLLMVPFPLLKDTVCCLHPCGVTSDVRLLTNATVGTLMLERFTYTIVLVGAGV